MLATVAATAAMAVVATVVECTGPSTARDLRVQVRAPVAVVELAGASAASHVRIEGRPRCGRQPGIGPRPSRPSGAVVAPGAETCAVILVAFRRRNAAGVELARRKAQVVPEAGVGRLSECQRADGKSERGGEPPRVAYGGQIQSPSWLGRTPTAPGPRVATRDRVGIGSHVFVAPDGVNE